MNQPADNTFEHYERKEGDEAHMVRFRLSESHYQTLARLARYHQTTIASLISGCVPRVIEKYRVLRALDVRSDQEDQARREQ